MRPTAELRVPMVPVAVELETTDAAATACELYLARAPWRGRHAVADDLAALLETDPPFLPVGSPSARANLIAKAAIRWVSYAIRDAEDATIVDDLVDGVPTAVAQPEPSEVVTLFDTRHDVVIRLAGGATLSGAFLHTSPADRPRVIDYLNRPSRFVRLWTADAHVFVNKRHVARVWEVD